MLKNLKRTTSLILLVFAFSLAPPNVSAQVKNIDWRTQAANGNWENGDCSEIGTANSQWFYPHYAGNSSRNRPDCNELYDLVFNNTHELVSNNNINFVDIWGITFAAGSSSSRTINGSGIDLRFQSGLNSIIRNLSGATHTINTDLALQNSPVEFNPIDADLIFGGNIFTNNNFIDVYGSNDNTLEIAGVISGGGGLAIKQNSIVLFTGDQTYTGETFVQAGTLILDGAANTNTITGDITISGGDLEYGSAANDEQINNNSNITISSGSWAIGARAETINSLNMTGGSVSIASGELAMNLASSIENANIFTTAGSASLEFNGLLQLGGSTIDYDAGSSGTNLFRLTSGLTTTSGSSTFTNSTIGFTSAFINLNNSDQTLTILSGADIDTEWGFTNGGLIKSGEGSLILRANSNYNDPTIIEEGVIIFETNSAIDIDSDLILDGGTLNVNGFSDAVGTVEVISNSTILLGTGSHSLQFQNSAATGWNSSAILTVENWLGTPSTSGSNGRIFVGNDATGLSPAQLSQISFDGYPGQAEILSTGEVVPSALDVVLFDSFNRANNNTVGIPSSGGSSWLETETAPATSARIENNQLRLQSSAAGRDFVSYDASGLYATAFDGATTNSEWRFNISSNRSNPSGFGTSSYGVAFVLGSSQSNFLSDDAFGYAVVIGESGTSDPVKLVKFSDGLDLNGNLITIASVTGNSADSRFSIAVTYESCTNTWSLIARDDGASFQNPVSGNFPVTVMATDNDYTSRDLNFMGALWNHGSAGTSFAEFDNFYIPNTSFNSEYFWNVSIDTDYQNPANWTPSRDCPRGRDRLVFNGSGNVAVTDVPNSEKIGQWIVGSGIDLRVEDDPNSGSDPDVPSEITLTGGAGDDFVIPAGGTMRFDCGSTDPEDALRFLLSTETTGDVDGTLLFQRSNSGSGPRHELVAVDANAINIEGVVIADELRSGWEPFGESGSPGSVIFQPGSIYDGEEGGSPFGDSGQPAQSIFNVGSTYIHRGNHSFQTGGRTYANFEYKNPEIAPQTLSFGSNNDWSMEDFSVLDGTLTLAGTNNFPFHINVSGDFEVGIDGTFNYAPVGNLPGSASTFTFNGSSPQTITVGGSLLFNDRVTLEVNNGFSSPGFALEIQNDIELFNDLIITDGEVQGAGAIITMSGNNTTLFVDDNGSIYGSGVGVGQDLSLVSNDPLLTLAGGNSSVCRFFNLTINDNLEFNVDRPLLEVQFGTFTVGDNSILRINTSGEAILGASVGPTYGVNSELIYNSGATTERGAEWSSTSGAGYPVNVTIQNGSTIEVTNSVITDYGIQGDLNIGDAANGTGTLTMIDVTNYLQVDGDVNIGTGVTAGILSLSSAVSGGDVRVRGDWNNNENGTFNPNGRAVYFNGSTGHQFINKLGATTIEVFDYLIIEKTSGNLVIGTNTTEVDARGQFGGDALQLFNGNFDLAGKTFNLGKNGNANGMSVSNGLREVFSLIPGAIFNIEGNNNKEISSSSGGALEFDDQTTVRISAGVNFGPSITTINASLEILAGGFANIDAPIYGPDGILIYNTGPNYDRRVEWDGASGGPGYPNDVIIRSGTSVLAATSSGFNNRPMNLDRNLTIESGGSLFLDGGSVNMNLPLIIGGDLLLGGGLSGSSTGGDIQLKGDWDYLATGSFFPNDCEVLFNGTSGQQSLTASSGVTFASAEINNADGLLLNNDLTITGDFNFNSGIVEPVSAEKITFENNSTTSNATNTSFYKGAVIKEGDDSFIFPVGDLNIDNIALYQPATMFFDLGEEALTSIEVNYNANESMNAGPFYDGSFGASGDLEEVGNCDYWDVHKTNNVDVDPKMSFSFTNLAPEYCNVIVDPNTLRVASWNTFQWTEISSSPSGSFIVTDVEISTLVTGGNYGEIAFTSGNQLNILPITLLSFQAKAEDRQVHTSWITASENNNDFFTIERSKDGTNWEEAGRVEGAGNSNTELSYGFIDEIPYSGISYYRLSQTDFDGTTTLSAPRAVEILQGNDFGLDRVYRGQDGLSLIYRATAPYVLVEIYDLLGKRIHGELIENYGNGFSTIHPDLARGAYILRLSHGSEMDSEKFVW